MNLYLFNANENAAVYGIGTYLRELIHVLKGSSVEVRIVHLQSNRLRFEIEKTDEIENWYIPKARNSNTSSGFIQKLEDYYRNVIYLLRLYIKNTTDLVFHFNYNQSYVLAKGLKEVFNCKTIATIHYFNWAQEYQGNVSRLHTLKTKSEKHRTVYEQRLYAMDEYESTFFKEVDRVIALSMQMINFLCSEYQLDPKKISVIPNGLAGASLELKINRDVLRRKWCLLEKEFLILFVGRLYPIKGLIFLIKAFRKLLGKNPNCRLIIVGNGDFNTYLKETKDICSKIILTGGVYKMFKNMNIYSF